MRALVPREGVNAIMDELASIGAKAILASDIRFCRFERRATCRGADVASRPGSTRGGRMTHTLVLLLALFIGVVAGLRRSPRLRW